MPPSPAGGTRGVYRGAHPAVGGADDAGGTGGAIGRPSVGHGCPASLRDFSQHKSDILRRVDIVDLVTEHVALKRRGARWVGLCPFHAEKTPSFTVSPDHGTFKCFGCGQGGDIFTFVELRENVPFIEAMRILADRAGVELRSVRPTDAGRPGRSDIAKVNDWACRYFRSRLLHEATGAAARAYVRGRDIADDTAARFGLGLAPGDGSDLFTAANRAGIAIPLLVAADLARRSDRGGDHYATFRNRLMFPIRDATRRVVGFGGRTLGDDRAKYLNTRQTALFDKGSGLYGIDLARNSITTSRRAVVVEGYTDCIAAHQAGFGDTVATLGTALTETQVDLIRRYGDQVILLFDSDTAGEQAAERAIHVALPRHVTVRLARLPEGQDPSDLLAAGGAERFSDVLNRAVDALQFRWSQAEARFRADASDARRRDAILDFVAVVADACRTGAVDAIQRGLLVNQVAVLLHLSPRDVHGLLRDAERRSRRGHGHAGDPTGRDDARATPVSGDRAAWRRVLGVLLNAPASVANLAATPDPDPVRDTPEGRIASLVLGMIADHTDVTVSDVLARCEDPGDARLVSELARRGVALGNYDATLAVAVEQLERGTTSDASRSPRERLASLSARAVGRPRRGFAPRRKVACDPGTSGA